MQKQLYWNNLKLIVTKETELSFTELKAMDIEEFFITIKNIELRNENK